MTELIHTPAASERRTSRPRRRVAVGVLVAALLVGVLAACRPPWEASRIDLRVLVLDDGSGNVAMIRDQLTITGVPHDVIRLDAPGRAPITPARLSAIGTGVDHAYYQGIVFPSHRPGALTATELDVIEEFQREFGIRRVAAQVWPGPESGPHWSPTGPLYSGTVDGLEGHLTGLGAAVLPWLAGPIPIAPGTWGALATTQPVDGKTTFVPLVTLPHGGQEAPILGTTSIDGYEEMQVTITLNQYQEHARLLAPVIVDFITRGVHLGSNRNHLSVHVDDIFLPDDRWSVEGNCTPGEDCLPGPGGAPTFETDPIRMTPADVAATIAWQEANDLTFEMAFNAHGADEAQEAGPDPLTDALIADRAEFEWINHTYRHDYLGCLKDTSVRPWRCETDGSGAVSWYGQADVVEEIQANIDWATAHDLPIDRAEVVTGEHSGLRSLPQQPDDNPNLAPALQATGIRWLASDASREPGHRTVGPATTVPRHPMNVFYNVATRAEHVDEYNWIYTSQADGGSGICEADPLSTCIEPLGPDGFESYIVPTERAIAMGHILGNDPRPHYVHQSNLAEERILLPVLDAILERYRSLYTDLAPLVVPSQTEAGTLMRDMTAWAEAGVGDDARVTAYRQGTEVVVEVDGAPAAVPLTVSRGASWGEPWGPGRSAWTTVTSSEPLVVRLP